MKIRKIKIGNNQILGNLDLDFVDKNGKLINNIILAGENGTGKTYLLDLIHNFMNPTLVGICNPGPLS